MLEINTPIADERLPALKVKELSGDLGGEALQATLCPLAELRQRTRQDFEAQGG